MPNSLLKPGLNGLFGDSEARKFVGQHWPHTPFAVHGRELAGLRDLPFLHSLESILKVWPKSIQAHLPDASDEVSSIDTTSSDAKKLFANQMGLLFNQAQTLSPVLENWLESLHADLGLPKMTYKRCMVYATPDGKGTATHFDQNINFVLQLTGTKTWWLAKNKTVTHPSQRHTLGQTLDPELASYLDEEMPTQMPSDRTKVVLKPGSILFVPQGYWHSTEAQGEALSLNFTFSQPSFADLLLTALRSRLLLSPDWRHLADGVSSSDPKLRETAAQKFDDLLLQLTEDLPNWNAHDILGATE